MKASGFFTILLFIVASITMAGNTAEYYYVVKKKAPKIVNKLSNEKNSSSFQVTLVTAKTFNGLINGEDNEASKTAAATQYNNNQLAMALERKTNVKTKCTAAEDALAELKKTPWYKIPVGLWKNPF